MIDAPFHPLAPVSDERRIPFNQTTRDVGIRERLTSAQVAFSESAGARQRAAPMAARCSVDLHLRFYPAGVVERSGFNDRDAG